MAGTPEQTTQRTQDTPREATQPRGSVFADAANGMPIQYPTGPSGQYSPGPGAGYGAYQGGNTPVQPPMQSPWGTSFGLGAGAGGGGQPSTPGGGPPSGPAGANPMVSGAGEFLPPIFTNPMTNQTNIAGQLQSYGAAGIPDGSLWQQGMYGGNQRDLYQGAFSPNAQNFQQGAWGPGAQNFQQGAFSQGASNFQQGAFSPYAQQFQQNAFSPQAMAYQNSLYGPGLSAMEQNFLGSGSALGRLGLEDAFNRVDDQFEGTPMASAKPKAYADAANQYALNMMNTGSQMGIQREQLANQNLAQAYGELGRSHDTLNQSYGTLNQGYGQLNNSYGLMGQATQNLGQMFGQPLVAGQAGQQAAGNLLNMFQQGMYGDTQFPLSLFNSWPIQSPTYIQPPAQQGGGGK